eukprot:m.142661 g.142661  ORF g.142661 m.142661 type:complete len:55 (+) comp11590_c3_seq1:1103-1267(+)
MQRGVPEAFSAAVAAASGRLNPVHRSQPTHREDSATCPPITPHDLYSSLSTTLT